MKNIPLVPKDANLDLDYEVVYRCLEESVRENLQLRGEPPTPQMMQWRIRELLEGVIEQTLADQMTRTARAVRRGMVHGLLLALLLAAGAARGQGPTSPSRRDAAVGVALDAADLTLRTLDFRSTHALLNSPCRCFHEVDPLSPRGRAAAPLLAFQYGMSLAVTGARRELARRHHPRLGWLVVAADIVSESIAVQHNMRQHDAPLAIGRTRILTPTPATVRIP